MIKLKHLEESIIRTLAYYETLGLPLTFLELSYLRVGRIPATPAAVFQTLDSLIGRGRVTSDTGFFSLVPGKATARARLEREKVRETKWRLLLKRAQWLARVPFVRAVFVSGSMACGYAKAASDFDMLVIVEHDRLWTTWLLASGLLTALNIKRRGQHVADRLCLNHFITDDSLGIPFPSLYNAQTYANLEAIYTEKTELVAQFYKANKWLKRFMASNIEWHHAMSLRTRMVSCPGRSKRALERILGGSLGNRLEGFARRYEEQRIRRHPLTTKRGGRVAWSQQYLEFHPDSKEKQVLQDYTRLLRQLDYFPVVEEKDSGLH